MSKRILVTGGAGFVGTHLVAHLVERGDDVVVLDSLEPQVHLGHEPVFPDGVSFIHGDVGDPAAADRALEGVDAVVHLAAAVGVGQSMYEIERYVRVNTLATASFLERLVALPPRPERLVVASSMSIYGEGEYRCPEHGSVAPGLRPEEQLLPGSGSAYARMLRAELTPIPTRESKPLIPTSVYAITKRDHEELCQVVGARVRRANRRPALLQRLRLRSGALEPVHGCRGDLLVAAAERPRAAHVRGRAPVEGFRPRQRHRRGDRARARLGGRGRASVNVGHRTRR